MVSQGVWSLKGVWSLTCCRSGRTRGRGSLRMVWRMMISLRTRSASSKRAWSPLRTACPSSRLRESAVATRLQEGAESEA